MAITIRQIIIISFSLVREKDLQKALKFSLGFSKNANLALRANILFELYLFWKKKERARKYLKPAIRINDKSRAYAGAAQTAAVIEPIGKVILTRRIERNGEIKSCKKSYYFCSYTGKG